MVAVLAQIFMGWPAILGSLGLSVIGIIRRSPKWLIGGALLSTGFAWYLTGWPSPLIYTLGSALQLLHLGGAVALYCRRAWIAAVLLVPHLLIASYLASVVLSQ